MENSLTPLKILTEYVYPILPSGGGSAGKAPLVDWLEYQNSYPTPEDLENWEETLHPTLWGIVTGSMPGVVVIDIDKPEQKALFDAVGLSPHVRTPRGGYHYWFRHPGTPVKTTVGIIPGVDVRGDKGFVNVLGKRTDGEYQILIPPSPDSLYSWEKLPQPIKDALINSHGNTTTQSGDRPSWVTDALTNGVSHGKRDLMCFRLACYFLRRGLEEDVVTALLNDAVKKWEQPPGKYFGERDVKKCIESALSAVTRGDNNVTTADPYYLLNSNKRNLPEENEISISTGQVTGQVQGKLREYGGLAVPFDKYLTENPEPHWKKEVAEYLGTTYKDESFQKLVRRRAFEQGQIKILHGGDKIQWVNREWKNSLIALEAGKRPQLSLKLPFGMEKYVGCSERSQLVVAGDVGSGKTHYGYLLADLNAGRINIRHFVNEMGESKAVRNLEDFPLLLNHYGKDYFLISQDKENLDVAENLDPDGLTIYDYLRMSDTKEWYLSLQKTLATLSSKVDKGMIAVMIQKKQGQSLGYGGEGTRMQAETYISLNVVKNVVGDGTTGGYKLGRIDIIKCREWAEGSYINPEGLSFEYRTAPKHGKLVPESLHWVVMERG